MNYITREHCSRALKKMMRFHNDLDHLYKSYGLCMLENTGRRNILLSAAQEEFFAHELSTSYKDVRNNGKTGEPDIMIGELARELECKITTPSAKGAIQLQTDYATLVKKGSLDYLYVIANREFDKFVVLHYDGLTSDDFRTPSPGSRGKAHMARHIAAAKCNVLFGKVHVKNKIRIEKLNAELRACSNVAAKKRANLLKSIDYWQNQPAHFIYEFEAVSNV